MKTKKWIILFLCFAVFLAGCGRKQTQPKETTEPTKQQMALQEETEPSRMPEEKPTEPSAPAPTEKPKEGETYWEDDSKPSPTEPSPTKPSPTKPSPTQPPVTPTEPTEVPTEPTEAPTKPTEVPIEPTEEPTKPTETPTEPTEVPMESEDEDTPEPNTEPGWGELQ